MSDKAKNVVVECREQLSALAKKIRDVDRKRQLMYFVGCPMPRRKNWDEWHIDDSEAKESKDVRLQSETDQSS